MDVLQHYCENFRKKHHDKRNLLKKSASNLPTLRFLHNLHSFLDGFLKINPSFEIAMSGRAGVGQSGGRPGSRASSEITFFSNLYATFILQWIAFILGRDEEEDQYTCRHVTYKRDNSYFLRYVLISPDVPGLPLG